MGSSESSDSQKGFYSYVDKKHVCSILEGSEHMTEEEFNADDTLFNEVKYELMQMLVDVADAIKIHNKENYDEERMDRYKSAIEFAETLFQCREMYQKILKLKGKYAKNCAI